MALDPKLRTSIVEGISVFLSLFDQPQVASMFCPPPPDPDESIHMYSAAPDEDGAAVRPVPGLRRRLPPLAELIEGGRVLALNMPAGANPALGRAIGVLLKNAWIQALLRRPAEAARRPGRYLRPAVFICDEYQAFATVGQDDPAGDEKAFALTRQCRCIPIVATQSISSLRSVLSGTDAWRTLVQTLRTRIFLSLSDESSARIASEMCGSVMKTQPSYTFTETTGRPEFSLLSGRAGGGEGHHRREQVVPAGPGAGVHAPGLQPPRQLSGDLPALRRHEVPAGAARLSEAPLPAEGQGLLAASRGGPAMKRASGIAHLKPFLPGLEAVLEDPEVSELMINGPGNVWVERGGELEPIEAPALTAAALYRAAIHIARPLGLDPATRPILDARLDDGSRVAICTPPASPHVAMTIRRFGGRAFSADDLVGQGALPEKRVPCRPRRAPASRRNILVSGGTGSGKTTLLNALIELLPEEERIVAIEDTLELRIDRTNCLRFEAGAAGSEAPVSIRDLVRHALRHRPDHIVVGEVQGRRGRRPAAGAQHRPRRIAHHRAREQRQLRAIAPGELRHAGRRRAPLGGHLQGRGRRHPSRRPHDPARGATLRRGGAPCQGLRRGRQPLAHRNRLEEAR